MENAIQSNPETPKPDRRAWHLTTHGERVDRWENVERVLLSMDEHTRTKHFDMSDWLHRNECGTIGCLAGQCALDPYFNSIGLFAEWPNDDWPMPLNNIGHLSRKILGSDGFDRVFCFDDFQQGEAPQWEDMIPIVRRFIEDLQAGKISRNDSQYHRTDSWKYRNRNGVPQAELAPEEVA